MDDVLIFNGGSRREVDALRNILTLSSKETRMQINEWKSTLTTNLLSEEEGQALRLHFPFEENKLDDGLKYLGILLKQNDYKK